MDHDSDLVRGAPAVVQYASFAPKSFKNLGDVLRRALVFVRTIKRRACHGQKPISPIAPHPHIYTHFSLFTGRTSSYDGKTFQGDTLLLDL